MTEALLRPFAIKGEVSAQESLDQALLRLGGNYVDFYPVTPLLQADYISVDPITDKGGETFFGG